MFGAGEEDVAESESSFRETAVNSASRKVSAVEVHRTTVDRGSGDADRMREKEAIEGTDETGECSVEVGRVAARSSRMLFSATVDTKGAL